jgi:hypothetical protein
VRRNLNSPRELVGAAVDLAYQHEAHCREWLMRDLLEAGEHPTPEAAERIRRGWARLREAERDVEAACRAVCAFVNWRPAA